LTDQTAPALSSGAVQFGTLDFARLSAKAVVDAGSRLYASGNKWSEEGSLMTYPMIGKRYYVEFPAMSFYLKFLSDTSLEFIVEKSPDLPKGSAHTVDIVIDHLRDELYLVSWQEKSGNTVVHLEDFREHRVHAFLTLKDLTFVRQSASLVEIPATSDQKQTG
jgi:hypothetical protein